MDRGTLERQHTGMTEVEFCKRDIGPALGGKNLLHDHDSSIPLFPYSHHPSGMIRDRHVICTVSRMGNSRKKIGLLCVLLIVSGGWITLASRQSGEPGGQGTDGRVDPSSAIHPPSSFLSDPSLTSSPGNGLGSGELFLKMMLAVGLIAGLGGAALYLSKRVLPRVVNASGKEIHVLETTYLGPRKTLHLVEVAGQRLLIASTNDRITMLAPVNEAWLDVSKQ